MRPDLRRGYGSLQWRPSEGDLLVDWPPLWPTHHLRSPETLAAYLEAGLSKVESIAGKPGRDPRRNVSHEELATLDQVFVGKVLNGTCEAGGKRAAIRGEALEELVHGLNAKARGPKPDRDQLGSAQPGQPSPMMWRLFPLASGKGYVPVMTWFPTGYDPQSPVRIGADLFKYLNGALGFDKSLTGNDLAAQASQPPAVQA